MSQSEAKRGATAPDPQPAGVATAERLALEFAQALQIAPDVEAMGPVLEQLLADARAAWPSLSVDEASYVRAVARAVPADAHWTATVRSVHGADLYLACAAADGDRDAIDAIERLCFTELPAYLGAIDAARASADDALQNLRQRLFCGAEGRAPKLRQYTGRGSLRAYVRLAAVRELFSLRRKTGRETPLDDAALVELATEGTAELAAAKGQFRELFKRCFQLALGSLSARERNLLRYQFLHGLSSQRIAVFYGVHKATVARWTSHARQQLRSRTRAAIVEELRARGEEVDELLQLVDTQIEVSLERVLGPEPSLEKPSSK